MNPNNRIKLRVKIGFSPQYLRSNGIFLDALTFALQAFIHYKMEKLAQNRRILQDGRPAYLIYLLSNLRMSKGFMNHLTNNILQINILDWLLSGLPITFLLPNRYLT